MKAGAKEAAKLLKVIEAGADSPEQAAVTILQAAYDLYESRARYFTAVQIVSVEGVRLERGDSRAGSAVLGPFVTELQAVRAAQSARVQAGGRVACWAVVLDMRYDATPGQWSKQHLDSLKEKVWAQVDGTNLIQDMNDLIKYGICDAMFANRQIITWCDLGAGHEGPHETGTPPPGEVFGLTQTVPIPVEGFESEEVVNEA